MDEKEYHKKYGEVPKDYIDRMIYVMKSGGFKDKDISKLQKRMKELLNMPTEEVRFVIDMMPKATPRPRASRGGHFYVLGAGKNSSFFKTYLEKNFPEQGIISTPCKFYVDLFMPIPSTFSQMNKILAELKLIKVVVRPDWDNLGKTYSDMVQKHLLVEDCTIYDARVRKFYSSKPRIEINIQYDTHYDSPYNKKKIESWNVYDKDIIEERDIL